MKNALKKGKMSIVSFDEKQVMMLMSESMWISVKKPIEGYMNTVNEESIVYYIRVADLKTKQEIFNKKNQALT